MAGFAAAHVSGVEEITDGRCPWRPVRHHFGIQSFGVNAWTAAKAGDRIINEHDENDEGEQQEELYFVQEGRARFELDGQAVDAPAGTSSSSVPLSPGRRSPKSRGRRSFRWARRLGRRTSRSAGRSGLRPPAPRGG
jgi:hypothetical protein